MEIFNVKSFGAVGDGVHDDTAAINAALAALPSCSVIDVGGHTVSGQTGTIFFPTGIYKITSLITIPAGAINFIGSGMSSWVPIISLTPYQNLGGTTIVTTNYTHGLLSCPKDEYGDPATTLILKDMDLRTVSPLSAQSSSTPPVVSLSGVISGEISNINVLEVASTGGISSNLYKIFSCEPGAAADFKFLYNIRAFGGTESVVIDGTHISANNIVGGQHGSNIGGVTACCVMLLQNDENYFSNIHTFSGEYGIALNFSDDDNKPLIIHGSHFEAVTHYLTTCFSPTKGKLILENPTWNASVDPVSDIASEMPSTISILSLYEIDRTGLYSPTRLLHVDTRNIQGFIQTNDDTTNIVYPVEIKRNYTNDSGSPRATGILFSDKNSAQASILAIRNASNSNYESDLSFRVNSGSGDPTEYMRIAHDGEVCITAPLSINGSQVIGERVVDARVDGASNSGDSTTDDLINALRDAMIAHGLVSAL